MMWGIAQAQSIGYWRYDTVVIQKVGGNGELKIMNGTRNVTGGLFTNSGNGVGKWIKPRTSGDTLFIGTDTILISTGTTTLQQAITASNQLTSGLYNNIDVNSGTLQIGEAASLGAGKGIIVDMANENIAIMGTAGAQYFQARTGGVTSGRVTIQGGAAVSRGMRIFENDSLTWGNLFTYTKPRIKFCTDSVLFKNLPRIGSAPQSNIMVVDTLSGNWKSIPQSSITGGLLAIDPMGKIFDDSSSHWTISSVFSDNGASSTDSAGHLVVSGGTSTLTKTTDVNINQRFGTTPYYTNLEDWIMEVKVRVIQHGTLPIGIRSSNISWYGFINTATGAVTAVSTAATTLTVNIKDYITLRLERHGEKVAMTARNITTNSAPVVVNSAFDYGTYYPPTTGKFAIFNFSGKYYIDSVGITSNTSRNAPVLIIGNSKTQFYPRTERTQNRWGSLLNNNFRTVVKGGNSETTADWLLSLPEDLLLNPQQVILADNSNDARFGVNIDSSHARFYRIERTFRDIGKPVYILDGFKESGGGDPSAWAAYIRSTRSVDSVIKTYDAGNVAGTLDADGIHPNDLYNRIIYNRVIASGKLSNGVFTAAPVPYIQNITPLEPKQVGSFNIKSDSSKFEGTLRINGYTSIGNAVDASSIATVPFRISTRSNENMWFYGNSTDGTAIVFGQDNLTTRINGNIIGLGLTFKTGSGSTASMNGNSSGLWYVGGSTSATSTLQVGGSFATQYTGTATGITLGASNQIVNVTATGQTITLPTAAGITGRAYTIKLTASGTGTVATTSSQTIDGSTTYSLSAQYKYVTVVSDGANWIITANN